MMAAAILPLRFSQISYTCNNHNVKQLFHSVSTSASLLRPRKKLYIFSRNSSALVYSHNDAYVSSAPILPGDVMIDYITGKRRVTEVAHAVWKRVIQKGDAVVDATCGNGNDTLAMTKMVAQHSPKGRVYAMDLQKMALDNTSSLLDESLDQDQKGLVKLFSTCHSKMEEVIPRDDPIRLVAFNLGYLPGGDKTVITNSKTTLVALEAAERMLASGGLISLIVYVGHPGGREEFEIVEAFAAGLPVDKWTCCKLQMLNRPLAPVLVFLSKR